MLHRMKVAVVAPKLMLRDKSMKILQYLMLYNYLGLPTPY